MWPDDPESIELLQQWFGYVISGETNLQKILGILGPIRSGKGTVCRVLRGLVGARNVTAPTLASFGQNFGLMDLIGKPVAIIGDVRLGSGESPAVVERLLSISGEDSITIDRKYRDPWTGQLPTRIMFGSNELPRFGDASSTVATRCLLLETTRSWLGSEDADLTPKLLTELPGILNWSLDGLHTLSELGRFREPASSVEARTTLADLVSPVSAFVRDRCNRGPLLEVEIDRLWKQWRSWADNKGHKAGTKQMFGRNLRAVIPGLGRAATHRVGRHTPARLRRRRSERRDLSGTHIGPDRGPCRPRGPRRPGLVRMVRGPTHCGPHSRNHARRRTTYQPGGAQRDPWHRLGSQLQAPPHTCGWQTHWTWAHLPVVFFDEDGEGCVADGNAPLRHAEDIAGFDGFQQSGQIVAILPLPPGVKVRYKHDDGARAIAVRAVGSSFNGDVVVLDSDSSGYMEEASAIGDFDGLTEPPEVEVRDR